MQAVIFPNFKPYSLATNSLIFEQKCQWLICIKSDELNIENPAMTKTMNIVKIIPDLNATNGTNKRPNPNRKEVWLINEL